MTTFVVTTCWVLRLPVLVVKVNNCRLLGEPCGNRQHNKQYNHRHLLVSPHRISLSVYNFVWNYTTKFFITTLHIPEIVLFAIQLRLFSNGRYMGIDYTWPKPPSLMGSELIGNTCINLFHFLMSTAFCSNVACSKLCILKQLYNIQFVSILLYIPTMDVCGCDQTLCHKYFKIWNINRSLPTAGVSHCFIRRAWTSRPRWKTLTECFSRSSALYAEGLIHWNVQQN